MSNNISTAYHKYEQSIMCVCKTDAGPYIWFNGTLRSAFNAGWEAAIEEVARKDKNSNNKD